MPEDLHLLEQLAASLQDDPAFMAWALARFRVQENLVTPETLCGRLEINRPSLARLSLCRRPRADAPDFAVRVREIAEFVPVDAATLAALLRQVEFLERLPAIAPTTEETIIQFPAAAARPPLLAAARDREEPSEKEENLPPPLADETR